MFTAKDLKEDKYSNFLNQLRKIKNYYYYDNNSYRQIIQKCI